MEKLTVMISSTARDLPDHREQVMAACLSRGMFPVMMEHLPASDEDAIQTSLRMVDECDIYLGVYALRYGYVPAGHAISITEMEYNRAEERNIPRLLFIMSDDHSVRAADVETGSGAEKLRAFKQRICSERVVKFFRSPEDLRAQVLNSLVDHVQSSALIKSEPQQAPDEISAEKRYRQLALESCDIINLANLPESDRHIATKRLELRRLYVSLRVHVEESLATDDQGRFYGIEQRRHVGPSDRKVTDEMKRRQRVSIGERLSAVRRLVVLGEPGSGKTTMIRWIATAYLLNLNQDQAWQAIPDVATLPKENWLPVIIRCRDLDYTALQGSLDDIFRHTLRKAEMSPDEVTIFQKILRRRLQEGEVLLLIDGLDEIADPGLRARFSQQIEQIHIAYPQAPIIATSRVVGYREMGYRLGQAFEHVIMADLSLEDKDDFIRRWCELTEPDERRERVVRELITDIHSTDRIERLTGSPMLLTTMALVKRKVGKLPSRRADLYWEAVQVLLNWRREVDEPLDDREAIPQLEYIAYVMCDRGSQQLAKDEIFELLDQMRSEYPRIHALNRHTPKEFLHLLESRTGLLVESGHVRYRGHPTPVYEFRHLTFQEYLAGRALVDGRFPDRDRSKSLADHVAPLAGRTSEVKILSRETEFVAMENWREALRLCVASCNDDDVDDVLLAILAPRAVEDCATSARPRAVLAALCLADEPNVSNEVARSVITRFVEQITEMDGRGGIQTSLDRAAFLLATSHWKEMETDIMVNEFLRRHAPVNYEHQGNIGGVCAVAVAAQAPPAWEEPCR